MDTNNASPVVKESTEQSKEDGEECLRMHVYEDKEYDIEEVKFWNFISKNKGVKPSIIRTVVYKCPESSYVVKKLPVYLPKPDKIQSVPKLADPPESTTPLPAPIEEPKLSQVHNILSDDLNRLI